MEKRNLLIVSTIGLLALTVGIFVSVFVLNDSGNSSPSSKSPYQLYCESHPNYHGTEAQWLDDLINGRLGDKKTYTVTFNSNGGSYVPSQTIEEGGKVTQPANPTKPGFNFVRWNCDNLPWSFTRYSINEDTTLVAEWSIISYSINYDYDGGSISFENPSKYTVENTYALLPSEKDGYAFGGWYDQDGNYLEAITKGMTGNLELTAKWIPLLNDLSISSGDTSKGYVDIVSGEGYTGESIHLHATPNDPNYAFKGWFDSDDKLVSYDADYTFEMPADDVYLVGKFDELRDFTISSSDVSKGIVADVSGDYVIGGQVVASCDLAEGVYLKGWYDSNDELVSTRNPYKFEMPEHSYSLIAKFMSEEDIIQNEWDKAHGVVPVVSEDDKTLTYGLYPQTVVDNIELIAELNKIESPEENGFYLYNDDYYYKKTARPFYSVNPIGEGVIIYQDFDNGEHIIAGENYWFRCEPISWNIISCNDGSYQLISEKLIDSQDYNFTEYSRTIDGKLVSANNYFYSSIRGWLTNNFFNSAFFLRNEEIQSSLVDNSAESTGKADNPNICEDTYDKVFLPSVKETRELFNTDFGARIITTDYSRILNVCYSLDENYLYCADYLTRSPCDASKKDVYRAKPSGYINDCGVMVVSNAIRPCINIKIK